MIQSASNMGSPTEILFFRCFHLSTMQIDKSTHFLGGFPQILPSCEIVSDCWRFLVPSEVFYWGTWSDFESKVCPGRPMSIQSLTRWCYQLLLSRSLRNLSNIQKPSYLLFTNCQGQVKEPALRIISSSTFVICAQPFLAWLPAHKIGSKHSFMQLDS